MTAIIQVPSIFPIKLPQGEWINLASFRRVAIDDVAQKIRITWDNSDASIFEGEQAQAILDALETAQARATGAGAQETPSEDEREELVATAGISMVALALLCEELESRGGFKAELFVKEFSNKARDFYENCSQKELQIFMDKYFWFLTA